MSEKRKDKKGRILKSGESQRADGRYMFRYTDIDGKRKAVYSWKLVEADSQPKDKKKDMALRDKEKEIERDMSDFISYSASKMTLNELFDLYMKIKEKKIKQVSFENYLGVWNKNIREKKESEIPISILRKHHFLKLFSDLINDGCGNGAITLLSKIINAILNYACDEDYIRKNYAKGCVRELGVRNNKRISLTQKEQLTFLKYVLSNKKYQDYYWLFVFMIETMCRVGEMAGVTIDDLDIKNKFWDLNHQLLYFKRKYYIDTPKTYSGIRRVPLSENAINAINRQKELLLRKDLIDNYEIDGYKNFIFLSGANCLWTNTKLNRVIHEIVDNYNKEELKNAKFEGREPFILPDFTTHVLRHTGCTRAAENGMDPKTLQTIMGHGNLQTTMKVYNHVDDIRMRSEIEKIDKMIEKL